MDPPEWVRAAFDPMVEAMALADAGETSKAVNAYREIPERQMIEWFHLHAQYAYKWRCKGVPWQPRIPERERDPRRLGNWNSRLSREVFTRDGYRCRYCGIGLLSRAAFLRFQGHVGSDVFPRSRNNRNEESAGPYVVFRPVADHVLPDSLGGPTDLSNLVTSCWPCNNGKNARTVEELGIADPRTRPPVDDGWDGLQTPRRARSIQYGSSNRSSDP